MATELRSIRVNATNALLDRRLHDIGWGLLLAICLLIIGASLVAKPLLTKTT